MVMVTSEDSKVHILDGIDVVRRYKGIDIVFEFLERVLFIARLIGLRGK